MEYILHTVLKTRRAKKRQQKGGGSQPKRQDSQDGEEGKMKIIIKMPGLGVTTRILVGVGFTFGALALTES